MIHQATQASGNNVDDNRRAGSAGQLVLTGVSHHYPSASGPIHVLEDVSLKVDAGSVACVVGPSGCGKSTTLTLAAGLQTPTSGTVTWDGAAVRRGASPDMAMAFQAPSLFPWMTVERNIAVGLRTRGVPKAETQRIVDEYLELVGLSDFRKAYPSQLSGGMAQRVGIARALALKPRLLLLDEPFAAVDAFTRLKLQQEFLSILKVVRPTVLFVTHDVSEAIYLGDVVVVMTPRPAKVKSIIPISPADRDRGSAAYAHKLEQILADLGVETSAQPRDGA